MQKALELKSLYYSKFVTEDGLGKIRSDEPQNDNGILFLAYTLAKFYKAKVFDQQDIDNAFKACESTKTGTEGVYKRSRHAGLLEAHDNLVGRAGLSVLCEFDDARKMADHGNKSGWSFNSNDPEKQELRTTLQGGSICFIKMCAGYIPYPLEYIWMLGGILVGGFRGYPSTANMNWFVVETLDVVFEKKFTKYHWTYLLFPLFKFIFKLGIKIKFGSIANSYRGYFPEENPIIAMSEMLNEKSVQ